LPDRPAINAGTYLLGKFAFEQLWNASRELDDFEPTRRLASCIGEDFSVLTGEQGCHLVEASFKDLTEAE
jgi:hypothetical protein